jgi:hypothetical protein
MSAVQGQGYHFSPMETSELLRRAWEAVKESGVPESLQEAAFHEAVEDLRAQNEGSPAKSPQKGKQDGPARKRSARARKQPKADGDEAATVDEGTFFSRLADESGVAETDLRDVLALDGSTVHVTPATRKLGGSKSEGARSVTALVAGARAFGLGEEPINAIAVHDELKRKRLWDANNFAGKHLGALDGFNQGGNRTELVTTTKWVGEFGAAVNQALGRTEDES